MRQDFRKLVYEKWSRNATSVESQRKESQYLVMNS